jgi:hypothetical protein
MLPFSFESENRTVRGILSMGGRELLPKIRGVAGLAIRLTGSATARDTCIADGQAVPRSPHLLCRKPSPAHDQLSREWLTREL